MTSSSELNKNTSTAVFVENKKINKPSDIMLEKKPQIKADTLSTINSLTSPRTKSQLDVFSERQAPNFPVGEYFQKQDIVKLLNESPFSSGFDPVNIFGNYVVHELRSMSNKAPDLYEQMKREFQRVILEINDAHDTRCAQASSSTTIFNYAISNLSQPPNKVKREQCHESKDTIKIEIVDNM